MISDVRIHCVSADQTLAVLRFEPICNPPLASEALVAGVVRGPYSERSHTLPAEFPLSVDDQGNFTARIIDPCYDTDELPMEYQLELTTKLEQDRVTEFKSRFQLRANSHPK